MNSSSINTVEISACLALALTSSAWVLACDTASEGPSKASVAASAAENRAGAEASAQSKAKSKPKSKPKPAVPKAGSLRLVVTSAHEPLGSEKAQLEALKASIEKGQVSVDASSPSAKEKQAAAELATGKSPAVESWSAFETVVVLELVSPDGTETGKRISRGRGHLFILHPPEKEPTFSTVYETPQKGAWFTGAKLGAWLATHLRYRTDDAPSDVQPVKTDVEAQTAPRKAE